MRRLLPLLLVALLPLGCADRTGPKEDKDVQVKESNVKINLPNLNDKEEKPAKKEAPSIAVLSFKRTLPLESDLRIKASESAAHAMAETLNASITRTLSRNPDL